MVIDLNFTAPRIKRLRKRLNLNQRDFAKELGVTQGAVSLWETEGSKGRTPQGGEVLARLTQLESETGA